MTRPGMTQALPRAFFRRPAPAVAHDLIGAVLLAGGVGFLVALAFKRRPAR